MKKIYLLICCFILLGHTFLQAQRLEKFSDNRGEFISQLQVFMTASKQKAMDKAFKAFELVFKSGMFNEEESEQILKTGNAMLGQRMSASPYFKDYLEALLLVKNAEDGAQRFKDWHATLDGMLGDIENRRLRPFQDFLRFSKSFFEHQTIRYSKSGTSWYTITDNYKIVYKDKTPAVEFEKLDLMAKRRKDSLFIYSTSGTFFPSKEIWKGKGGKVTWERFGLDPSIYAELTEYEFEVKKSLYEAKNVKLHYPLFFGNTVLEGDFRDKLLAASDALEGSYPRFESYDKVLEIDNIGKGIKYRGGFRLFGTTVYGFGTKEEKATINLYNAEDKLVFFGSAESFTIKREERIVGERVEATFYFDQDSLYHPSVNIRFNIPSKEIQLSRGKRGSDRNPFFNSMHKVNIDSETLNAYIDRDSVIIGKKTISIAKKGDVYFESLKFFKKNDYQRLQNIATANPVAIMKATAEHEGTNFIDANLLATRINSKFSVDNIQSLLYDLVSKGFINYDGDQQLVEVKDKVFHYVDADQEKVDYDVLRIQSNTDKPNAVLNLKENTIDIEGVKQLEFSHRQKVALKPFQRRLKLKENRNLDFDGKLFAGFGTIQGKDFHFDYEKFQVELDSIRYFDLFVPNGKLDKKQSPIALSMGSRMEHLTGVLLIDAPSNKSGAEDIEMFPSFISKGKSYVYYDYDSTQNNAYQRDSFYFELEPFSFNHLDNFTSDDLKFKGEMFSSNIFPNFKETLVFQHEDQSLGFETKTPEGGYPNYEGKGNYEGTISLSNKGLLGKGNLKYLGASVNSEDFIFKPKQLLASAERFDLAENRPAEVPQAKGFDVKIDWRPYRDSMYVTPEDKPFDLFREDNHTMDGTLILTPGGLKGEGLLDWDKASMRSNLFSFGAFSVKADTTNISIKALESTDAIALQTSNVKGEVDFDEQFGNFEANDEFLVTTLPYNQYITSMNEFNWDMKKEDITFKADESKLGTFVSIHPDQDSLEFQGKTAFYDLKTYELKIGGVPYIIAADAYIYPDSNKVEIQPGGVMRTLENSQIIADTLNKYHVINRATVEILGRKLYKARGFYEFNIGDRKQEIDLQNIVGQRVGKGKRSEKKVVTRATGEVTEQDKFYIDHKTEFKGTISLNAESKNLKFDGFARLDADKLPQRNWFTVSSEGDKNDLAIQFDKPKSFEGYPLRTGLFLSKETAQIYPTAMMPLMFRKDRPILPVKGVFKYNKEKDYFIFGDSSKVMREELKGNMFTFKNQDAKVEAEGRFNIGSGLKYIKVDAAGIAKTEFPPEPIKVDENIMLADDTLSLDETPIQTQPGVPVNAELMSAIQLIIPEQLMNVILTDFKSSSFDARNVTYLTDINFYKKAASEIFPNTKEVKDAINSISSGFLDIPEKANPYTFVFSKIKMKWDPEYQSFISTDKKMGLMSINGEPIHKMVTAYVEFKMPSNEDDRLYIYLKSPSELYYFFGFKQGILNVVSNNPRFTEILDGLKNKDKIQKMSDGETYEIQPVEPGTAKRFLRRIEAANK